MERKVLNYRILVEKEQASYSAYCPVLGLADFGKTIDEAVARISDLIRFHIESLSRLGYTVPVEKEATTVITSVDVPALPGMKFSLA